MDERILAEVKLDRWEERCKHGCWIGEKVFVN